MKRFTETEKWRKPWFRKLTGPAKLLWMFLCENCNQIGLIEFDPALVSSDLGIKITESHMSELSNHVQRLDDKLFLRGFIWFQYGELSPQCPPHKTVIRLIEQHGLKREGLDYAYPSARVATTLEDKEEDKEKDKKGIGDARGRGRPESEQAVIEFTRTLELPDTDGSACWEKWSGNGFKNDGKAIVDWKATIRSWKLHGYLPSQKQQKNGNHRHSEADRDFARTGIKPIPINLPKL